LRLGYSASNTGPSRKVNYASHRFGAQRKQRIERRCISRVTFYELKPFCRAQAFGGDAYCVKVGVLALGVVVRRECVQSNNAVAAPQECLTEVAADVSSSTGDDDGLTHALPAVSHLT